MNNDKNAKSFYVQAMVQNYLEHTYNTESIKFYPELINDIDLFRSDISKLIIKYGPDGKSNYPTISVFLEEINPNDYLESYEIKFRNNEYITKFENLLPLITKIKYPLNTKLILVLVPTQLNVQPSDIFNVSLFEEYKRQVLSLDKSDMKDLFNSLCNEGMYLGMSIVDVLDLSLVKSRKGSLNKIYINELNDEEFEAIKSNFERVEIKVLGIEELAKYPMDTKFQIEYALGMK